MALLFRPLVFAQGGEGGNGPVIVSGIGERHGLAEASFIQLVRAVLIGGNLAQVLHGGVVLTLFQGGHARQIEAVHLQVEYILIILRQKPVIDHMASLVPEAITVWISYLLRESDHDIKILSLHLFYMDILTIPQK